ncbi:MAG: hypothetical protein ACR2JW_14810 [Thermomicrobiales bacterium]
MLMYAAIPLTCWLCALVAIPRKPLPNNEVQELVYSRLLGRQERLALLAFVVTAVAFIVFVAGLSQRAGANEESVAGGQQICSNAHAPLSTCYTRQMDGQWKEEQMQADGSWRVLGFVSHPDLTEQDRGG